MCVSSGKVFFLHFPLCPAAQPVYHGQRRPDQHVDLKTDFKSQVQPIAQAF